MFPTIVYKVPGTHFASNGKTYNYRGVKDSAELAQALSEGWHESLIEAINPVVSVEVEKVDEVSPPSRDELETKAIELGLKFDGRTSDRKLNFLIEEALKAV